MYVLYYERITDVLYFFWTHFYYLVYILA